METLVVEVKGEKLKALKAFLLALEIPYSAEQTLSLDEKIKQARKEKEEGSLKVVDAADIWGSI